MTSAATNRLVASFDGTPIALQTVGDGAPIVLANGLGGTMPAWRLQVDCFRHHYRFVSWDYRGLYRSATPSDRSKFRVEDHARDLEVVLREESIDDAIFIGWSMGIQVLLEFYRRAAHRFKALILINGTYRRPFETAFNWPLARFAIPRLLDIAYPRIPLVQPLLDRVTAHPRLLDVMKRLRLISASLNDDVFHELAREYSGMDFQNYIDIFRALNNHDASEVLPAIRVPTLLIAGQRDFFSPIEIARTMHRTIPGAELLEIPLGTHYTPVEFPDVVNLRLEKFFRDHNL